MSRSQEAECAVNGGGSSGWRPNVAIQGLHWVTVEQTAGFENLETQNSMVLWLIVLRFLKCFYDAGRKAWSLFSLPSWYNQPLLIKGESQEKKRKWDVAKVMSVWSPWSVPTPPTMSLASLLGLQKQKRKVGRGSCGHKLQPESCPCR